MNKTKLNLRSAPSFVALLAITVTAMAAYGQKTPTAGRQNAPVTKSEIPPSWKEISIPPLPAFHPQEPKRIELANGMVIFLQEDHELPLIDGVARIRGGGRDEPAGKAGFSSIYGESWRTGGTAAKTGDELDQFLESRAARVETSASLDSSTVSWSSLKGDFDQVFPVFLDVLMHPEFRQNKIDLAKQQIASAISRRNDDIDDIVGREAAKIGYGPDNPYARIPEYYTVGSITRQDLLDFHKKYVQPNNIVLGVVGDFDPAQMEAKLRQAFSDWPRGPRIEEPKIEFQPPQPAIYFASKPDVNQSEIQLITLGIERRDPDFYATRVMNEILGGGFSSRLFNEIRAKQGLAYSVGGGIGAAFDHPGLFRVGMGTKSATTVQSVEALRNVLKSMDTQPVTEDELKRAKDSILNAFVFNFDSKEKVMMERMAYEFYGYPADFLERYRAGIEKVTAADVDRVAKKYVHPGQMAVLVVGNEAEFGQKLSTLGPVKNIDLTIPEAPPGEKPADAAGPSASNPEGKALIGKVAQALGGEAKLQSVKTELQKSTQTLKSPQGEVSFEIEATIAFPDRVHLVAHTPMGDQSFTVTPDSGFAAVGSQVQDLPPEQRSEYIAGVHRDLIFIAQHAADPKFVFSAAGQEKVGDSQAAVLDVNSDGTPIKLYVDPQSGRVLRSAYHVSGRMGPAEETVDYSDWKPADGLTLPFARAISQNGQQTRSVTIQSIAINVPVDPKLFQKPSEGTGAAAQK